VGDIIRHVELRDADLPRAKVENLESFRAIYERSLQKKSKQVFLEIKRGQNYRFFWMVPDYSAAR
jgi:hypothetical protein